MSKLAGGRKEASSSYLKFEKLSERNTDSFPKFIEVIRWRALIRGKPEAGAAAPPGHKEQRLHFFLLDVFEIHLHFLCKKLMF